MAWIESHQEVQRHPKTKRLRRALGLSLPTVVGHLHMFWWWALTFAEDGDLSNIEDENIAEESGWEGDPEEFIAALVSAGFVNEDRTIHDWDHYTGRIRKQRQGNRDRQQRWRENNPPTPKATRVVTQDLTPHNASVTRDAPLYNPATGPDLTKPNLTGPDLLVVDGDGGLGEAPPAAPAADAATPAAAVKDQAAILRGLSEDARSVLDHHRKAHNRPRPTKLNPESAVALEEAVADLGLERLRESISYMARKIPAVPELSKAITAARTKRKQDETPNAAPDYRNGHSSPPSTNRSAAPSKLAPVRYIGRGPQNA